MQTRYLAITVVVVAIGAAAVSVLSRTPLATDPHAPSRASTAGEDHATSGGITKSAMEAVTTQEDVGARDPQASASSWSDRYQRSTDHFAFAQEAAKAAIAGDARAQYFLARVLLECHSQVRFTAYLNRGSLAANIEARFEGGHMPEHERQKIRSRVIRCEGFFDGNPLADFSLPEEAQSHRYWKDQAISSGDPLALMDRAFEAAQDSSTEDVVTRRATLLSDVRVAVEAKDPAAIAKVGWLYALQNVGREQSFQGPAWLIAACELGYDCSMRNPELGQGCADAGTCNAGLMLADAMQRDLGATRFGAIYAASQDIVYKINTGDWEGLQPYLETKF